MAQSSTNSERNRRIRHEVNATLARRARELLGKARLGIVLQAEEGMEVDGFAQFELAGSVRHIDFSRLTVPWQMLSLAMLNQEIVVRRFTVVPEHFFYVVIDLSRSMRYPLIRLYGGGEVRDEEIPQIYDAKLSLAKVIAGAVGLMAAASGFTVKIVTFGPWGITEHKAIRHKVDLPHLYKQIDDHMLEITEKPHDEEPQYDEVAKRLMNRKGRALFVGDFMDGSYAWDNPDQQRKAIQMLGTFRNWAVNRPLAVVRVNHFCEVRPPGEDLKIRGRMVHPMGDRCDINVETEGHENEGIAYEHYSRCIRRLTLQQRWQRELDWNLRNACAGYVSFQSRDYHSILKREMGYAWARVTGG